jgi:hypothetical protein
MTKPKFRVGQWVRHVASETFFKIVRRYAGEKGYRYQLKNDYGNYFEESLLRARPARERGPQPKKGKND